MTPPFSIPVLTTERLILRPLGQQDLAPLTEFYASNRSQFVGGPASAEQVWRMLAAEIGHWALRGYGRWGVDITGTGETCGMVGLWNPEGWPEPEVGWDLYNGFEGKGYATEAARAVRDHAYGTLGWRTLISLINPANAGSQGVARRLGAAYEGGFQHARFGLVEVWRHPSAEGAA